MNLFILFNADKNYNIKRKKIVVRVYVLEYHFE